LSGGTPELVQFTQGLEKQQRQRYIVALADVNLQTMTQMGAARSTPVIATQAVPMVNASLPVVRSYRETMARLFDEPPVSLSLAGFIAARYTFEVLRELDGPLTRKSVLARLPAPRARRDVGGYRVTFNNAAAQRHVRHAKHADAPTGGSSGEPDPARYIGAARPERRLCYAAPQTTTS
jgi:hypothetical protein